MNLVNAFKIFIRGKKIVTRIAPSPTGNLHVGTARTALFNYLFAKGSGGKFILRIEDTDQARSKKEYDEDIRSSLQWLGLEYDELHRQSERTEIYKKYLTRLVEKGKAYVSREPGKNDPEKMVDVVRLKNLGKEISFVDRIRGTVSFHTKELGDFVIARSFKEPLYHLAVVVDDFEMGVTHVIRGEDHISNTPRQILIQEALGFPRPEYAHIPLILAPDRSKLSKRHGAISISEYRRMGILPEAMKNYLAYLGWNPGDEREILSPKELLHAFSLKQVQKGGAIFDMEKLRWYNREYLKQTPLSAVLDLAEAFVPSEVRALPRYSKKQFEKILPILLERISLFSDIPLLAEKGDLDYFFSPPKYQKEKLFWKKDADAVKLKERLMETKELLSGMSPDNFTKENVKKVLSGYAEKEGRGSILWPLRVALSGKSESPDPFTLAETLGKSEVLKRVEAAIQKVE